MAADLGGIPFRFQTETFAVVGVSSTAEAVIATLDIPAGFVDVGDRVNVKGLPFSVDDNSTNTHRYRLRMGGLTGPVLDDTGAVDGNADDVKLLEAWCKVLKTGGASVAEVAGSGPGAVGHKGTAAATYQTEGAPLRFVLTGQAGASHADNQLSGLDLFALVHKRLGS